MKKFSVVSLFSGVGGLDLGFSWAGCDLLWATDIEDVACKSFSLNFEHPCIRADINKLDIGYIPDADIIIGGPPCQSFSLVGQRKLDDPRGQLVFRFYDVIREKKPLAFVMENVPGMAASTVQEKRLPGFLAAMFEKIGYKITLTKLNASNYLVPQKRQRLFLIGSRFDGFSFGSPASFAKSCYNIDLNKFNIGALSAIGDLGDSVNKGELAYYKSVGSYFSQIMRKKNPHDRVTLHESPRMSETDKLLIKYIPPGGNYMDVPDEFSTGRILKFKKTGGRTTTYGRLHPDLPAYTINTYFRRPNVGANFHYELPRLITAREAMRFQSIPDYFQIIPCRQDVRNALIGNAVPPLLAHAVAWSLCNHLDTNTL